MTFNANEHITNLRGKQYLEVKWRLVWFREEHPRGGISTEIINTDPVLVRAIITSDDGQILATGHGSANDNGQNVVWKGKAIEKAETAAIGRALAHAGYGTQFAPEDDEEPDTVVDSPIAKKAAPNPFSGGKPTTTPPPAENAPKANVSANNITYDWFTKPVGETWKDLHPYLLEHIYGGNKIGKDKSMAHHAKLTNQWAGMTAGEVVKYLETRHEEASGQ